ncbi:mitochondrial 54S ribosomal protein uL4m [Limtongia smithiae]|uniref:mitochondrial 54S ribosomal protein uL4m n=1 Tax=Limtongia smithiae TaxID=1125753 RepID=UPI0034CF0CC5
MVLRPVLPRLGRAMMTRHSFIRPATSISTALVTDPANITADSLTWTSIATPDSPLANAGRPPAVVLTTLHSFPALEPSSCAAAPSSFLFAPFRRDILWQAITYENDSLRNRGGLYVRNRSELGYSKKKMAAQKGRGRARVGKAGSPIFQGGGKPFGPRHPDDSTELNRRVYNMALRTAFSYAYKRGFLAILEDGAEIATIAAKPALRALWSLHAWEKTRVLFISSGENTELVDILKNSTRKAKVVDVKDLDVRSVLRAHKIVVEKAAFDYLVENTEGKKFLNPAKIVSQIKRKARRMRLHATKRFGRD